MTTSFHSSAKAAIAIGHLARQKTAEALAVQFTESGTFDPSRLTGLGPSGLVAFLDAVAKRGVEASQPPLALHDATEQDQDAAQGAYHDWAAQRRREPLWIARAVSIGTGLGFLTLLCGTMVLHFLTYL